MDVRSAFISQTKSSKVVQPGDRSLNNPSVFSKTASMFRIPFCEKGRDSTSSQFPSNPFTVIRAVRIDPFGTFPRSTSPPSHGRYVVQKRQDFVHIMAIGTGEPDGQGNSFSVDQDVMFRPETTPICWIWPGFFATFECPDGRAVDGCARPPDFAPALQFVQYQPIEFVPDSRRLPITQTPPTCHPGAAKLTRQPLPWQTGLKNKHNALQNDAIVDSGTSSHSRISFALGQQRLDAFPQFVTNLALGHFVASFPA